MFFVYLTYCNQAIIEFSLNTPIAKVVDKS